MATGRRLGAWETYTVSKANILCPSTVSFLATFPLTPASPTSTPAGLLTHPVNPDNVKLAITHLLREHPLLRCGIAGGRTRTPSFALRDDTAPEEVLVVVPDADKSEAEVLDEQVNTGLTFDGSRGPLWRVTLYEATREGAGPRLCLTMAHTLGDGGAIKAAFHKLLVLVHPSNASTLSVMPTLVSTLPPSLEDTVNVKPTFPAMLRLVKDELIKPKLRPILPPRPPKLVPYSPPYDYQPVKTALLRVPPASIAALKALAKAHGLATLHPLLHGAVLAALTLASPVAAKLKAGKKGRLNSITPISVRDTKLGHPLITGNYISALSMDQSVGLTSDFFVLCRQFATRLNSSAGRAAAKHLMGAVALIPNPKPKSIKPATVDKQGNKVYPITGIDAYMMDHRDGVIPSEGDVAISNLTVFPKTGWEGDGFEVCWGQTVGPYEGPLTVSIMSIVGGDLTIASNWIGGTMDKDRMAVDYAELLEKVIARLVGGVEEGVTIADLGRD